MSRDPIAEANRLAHEEIRKRLKLPEALVVNLREWNEETGVLGRGSWFYEVWALMEDAYQAGRRDEQNDVISWLRRLLPMDKSIFDELANSIRHNEHLLE